MTPKKRLATLIPLGLLAALPAWADSVTFTVGTGTAPTITTAITPTALTLTSEIKISVGTGTTAVSKGAVAFSAVTFTKTQDESSAALILANASGGKYDTVEIVFGAATYKVTRVYVTKLA